MNDNTKSAPTPRTRKKVSVSNDQAPVAPSVTEVPTPAKAPTKLDRVLAMLRRPEGASLDDLVAATGWLPHTTRAALTGLRKKGHVLTSTKDDGKRRYQLTGEAA